MPHARRCPLPSAAARPGGGGARPLDRLSRRPAPHGPRPRPGPRRRHRDGQRVGPDRDRRRRPGWGARPPDLPPRVDTGVAAAAPFRPPPPESPRLARRSRQGRGPRGRPRARGGRGGLRAPPRAAPLVALGGGRVPRRDRGARLRLPRVDRPALLPAHAARRRGAARAAPHPRAPRRRPGGRRVDRRAVAEERHRERRGRRARPHAAHRALRHARRAIQARGDRVRPGPRAGPPRPRGCAPRPRRPGRADARELLAGGRAAARRRAHVRAGGSIRSRRDAVARARAPRALARGAPARQRLLALGRAAGRRLRPGDDGQSRGVHRRDGAARRAQPRGAAAEPIERARALLAPGARPADRARQRRPRMTRRRTLRTLVEAKQGLIVPGAYDGISAKLVQQAGFPAVYMTGYGTSASRLGLPDLGFAGLAEMADHARSLVAVLDIPLIADADTGYGNALNVRRTVQVYEAAGVAALHIEDQITPKRCGHLAGHQVIPRGEFIGKIRAAVEARTDPDLLVIARTDAISAVDFDEALRRGEAAAKAGADVLFIEAPRDEAQVERVARAFDTPLLYNYAPGGRSPLLPFARLRQLRFAIVLLPVDTLFVAAKAVADFLRDLRAGDDVRSLADRYIAFGEFNDLIGVTAQLALAERYRDDGG